MKGLFLVAGFLVAVSGCGRNPPESDTSNSNQTLEQRYQVRTNLIAVVDGNTAFAMDLYLQIRSTPGNLFLSPYSLSSALAMTYAGARGRTEQQMANTLHFTLPQNRLHAQFGELQESLNAAQRSNTVQLLIANSLWPAKGLALKQDFLAQIGKNYQARLTPLDYGQTEAARLTINGWVEEQTRQKIKELLKRGVLGPDTVLVLANAIYFKGAWATPFKPEQTRALPFRLSSTKQINVPTMQGANMECGYYAEPDVQLLELPYKGERLSMVILLPTEVDGLAALEQGLTALKLQGWIGGLRKTDVRVWLPRFKATSEFELSKTLKALGMVDAFGGAADFSGMFGNRVAGISEVAHKAVVEVNEEGTEAAAATAVVMTVSSPPRFNADHPFLFLVRDRGTGSILFLGRIMNPGQTSF